MALGGALCFFFSSNMFRGVRIFFITVFLYMKLMMRISPVYLGQEMRSNSRDDMASHTIAALQNYIVAVGDHG